MAAVLAENFSPATRAVFQLAHGHFTRIRIAAGQGNFYVDGFIAALNTMLNLNAQSGIPFPPRILSTHPTYGLRQYVLNMLNMLRPRFSLLYAICSPAPPALPPAFRMNAYLGVATYRFINLPVFVNSHLGVPVGRIDTVRRRRLPPQPPQASAHNQNGIMFNGMVGHPLAGIHIHLLSRAFAVEEDIGLLNDIAFYPVLHAIHPIRLILDIRMM